ALAFEVLDLLLGLVLCDAVGLLQAAREPVALAGNVVDLVVRQLAPLLANSSLELPPATFDAVPIHGVTWWIEMLIMTAAREHSRSDPNDVARRARDLSAERTTRKMVALIATSARSYRKARKLW